MKIHILRIQCINHGKLGAANCILSPPPGGEAYSGYILSPFRREKRGRGEVGSTPVLDLGVASRSSGRESSESRLGLGPSMEKVTSFAKYNIYGE
jgi:hypothetical protein